MGLPACVKIILRGSILSLQHFLDHQRACVVREREGGCEVLCFLYRQCIRVDTLSTAVVITDIFLVLIVNIPPCWDPMVFKIVCSYYFGFPYSSVITTVRGGGGVRARPSNQIVYSDTRESILLYQVL